MTTTDQDVEDALKAIGLYVNRPVPAPAIAFFTQAFAGKIDRRIFSAAMGEWMRSHGPNSPLPSVKDVQAVIAEARREEHEENKRALPASLGDAAKRQVDPYVRAGLAMLARYCDPRTTWRQRAAMARAFARETGVLQPWSRMADECDIAARSQEREVGSA